jgi:hypothetical protein
MNILTIHNPNLQIISDIPQMRIIQINLDASILGKLDKNSLIWFIFLCLKKPRKKARPEKRQKR